MMRLFAIAIMFTVMGSAVAGTTSFPAMMNNIIRGTPGVTNIAIPGAVRVGTTGTVAVATASGLVIPVATSAAADVGFGAIALGAARVGLRVLPYVGVALTAAEIARQIANSDYKVCPPPQFFCKPDPTDLKIPPGAFAWGYPPFGVGSAAGETYKSAESACNALLGWFTSQHSSWGYNSVSVLSYDEGNRTGRCRAMPGSNDLGTFGVVPTGPAVPKDPVQVTNDELAAKLNVHFAQNQADAVALKAKIDEMQALNPGTAPAIDMSNAPLSVSAPPVSLPPKVLAATQVTNADGTTSTQTVTEQTTVTPNVGTPSTVGNPNITFPSSTTTTTSVTNNVTGVTKVSVETKNEPPPPPGPATALDLPTDYNREVTQQSILEELSGAKLPPAPIDPSIKANTDKDIADKGIASSFTDIPNKFASDKASWFSWVWTPPVGACTPSTYTGSVHGYTVAFDICPWVANIRDVIGFLFALFGAMNIYGNLFRKQD